MQNFEFLKYFNFQGDENRNDTRTFYFNLSRKDSTKNIYILSYILYILIYNPLEQFMDLMNGMEINCDI